MPEFRSDKTAGFSLLELAVVAAIIALVLVLLVPRLNTRPNNFTADLDEFKANLEVTRMLARGRTGQYRLRVATSSQYVIERGTLVGITWTFPTVERTVGLRTSVAFGSGSVGLVSTFDSRGRLTTGDTTFTMLDTDRGWSRQILVRSTGMVQIQ
ncbi:MAG: prepilin-type N-terminal cleavage/methylation domain-containing protein [Armatimonadota bacterium]